MAVNRAELHTYRVDANGKIWTIPGVGQTTFMGDTVLFKDRENRLSMAFTRENWRFIERVTNG